MGYEAAGVGDTTGDGNTGVGYRALYQNSSGSNNTAIGNQTLWRNSSGSNNTAIGNHALSGNDTGNYNTAIGPSALNGNSSGENNTASGYRALVSNGTGSNNTAFGYKACAEVTGSNKTCIGANSGPVHSSSIAKNDAEAVYLGTSSATVYIPGNLVVSGTFTAPQTSDRRLKNIKGENKSGLAQVRELKVYDFTFKNDKEHKPHVGVIAQDLEKVFPNAVIKGDDGYLKIRRDDMFYAMVNAIKELDAKLTALVEEVKSVIARIDKRDEEIKALQDEVKSLQAENATLKKQNQDFEQRLERLEKLF